MECQFFSVFLLAASFFLLGACTIMLWKKLSSMSPQDNQVVQTSNRNIELEALESRMNDKIASMERLINSQSTLISVISNNLHISSQKEIVTGEEEGDKTPVDQGQTRIISNIDVSPHIAPEDAEKKLDNLLNGADFTERIWQQFSRPFNLCAEKLIAYLGENGLPMPRIEPYPALQDNNPNFWTFMIVQALNWRAEGKRFLIPRNFDRYDPLWHAHLFEIRGNTNKPDNYINGLVRCAVLKNGILTGYIDKKLVETKGIIKMD
jgi:hypothetical protein